MSSHFELRNQKTLNITVSTCSGSRQPQKFRQLFSPQQNVVCTSVYPVEILPCFLCHSQQTSRIDELCTLEVSIPGSICIQEMNGRGLEDNERKQYMSITNLLSSIVTVQVAECSSDAFPSKSKCLWVHWRQKSMICCYKARRVLLLVYLCPQHCALNSPFVKI